MGFQIDLRPGDGLRVKNLQVAGKVLVGIQLYVVAAFEFGVNAGVCGVGDFQDVLGVGGAECGPCLWLDLLAYGGGNQGIIGGAGDFLWSGGFGKNVQAGGEGFFCSGVRCCGS